MTTLSKVTPNQDQVLGIVKNILAILAGILISHGFVNSAGWEQISGFITVLVIFIWGYKSHDVTLQSFISLVRTGASAIGGYLVFKGIGNTSTVDQISSLLLAIAPIIWSLQNHQEPVVPPDPVSDTKLLIIPTDSPVGQRP